MLAKAGTGSTTKQFVTKQADTALEWLEHDTARSDAHTQFAVCILLLLVRHQPSHFSLYIRRVFFSVFCAIYHPKAALRTVGVELLSACLGVWRGRSLYPRIYAQIEAGLQLGREES